VLRERGVGQVSVFGGGRDGGWVFCQGNLQYLHFVETGNFVYLEFISEFVSKVFFCQIHPEFQALTIETKVFFCFFSVWEAKNEKPTFICFDAFRFVALLMLLVKIKSVKEMSRGTKDFGKSKY
jgi:hypothetical protein